MKTPDDERRYYAARAASARELAERAARPGIAAIHLELATRYEQLMAQAGQQNDSVPVSYAT